MPDRVVVLSWLDRVRLCGLVAAFKELDRYCEKKADSCCPEMKHDNQGAARAYRLAAERLEEELTKAGVTLK